MSDPVTNIPGVTGQAGTPSGPVFTGNGPGSPTGTGANGGYEQLANMLSISQRNMQDLMELYSKNQGDSAAQQLLITKIQEQTKQTEQIIGLFASIRALPFTFSDKFGQKLGV